VILLEVLSQNGSLRSLCRSEPIPFGSRLVLSGYFNSRLASSTVETAETRPEVSSAAWIRFSSVCEVCAPVQNKNEHFEHFVSVQVVHRESTEQDDHDVACGSCRERSIRALAASRTVFITLANMQAEHGSAVGASLQEPCWRAPHLHLFLVYWLFRRSLQWQSRSTKTVGRKYTP